MARRVVPFWSRVARQEEGRAFYKRLIGLADRLDGPALAASLLQPFAVERLTPVAAPRLIALHDRYGGEV